MIIVEYGEYSNLEPYGFFLGDIGKFLFKAIPASIGGFVLGGPIGAGLGALTGFIGGNPDKIFKRFLYGLSAGGIAGLTGGAGITGIVTGKTAESLSATLTKAILSNLSKIPTLIKGQGIKGISDITIPSLKGEAFIKIPTSAFASLSEEAKQMGLQILQIGSDLAKEYLKLKQLKEYRKALEKQHAPPEPVPSVTIGPVSFTAYKQKPERTTPISPGSEIYLTKEGYPVVHDPHQAVVYVPASYFRKAVKETEEEINAVGKARKVSKDAGNLAVQFLNLGLSPDEAYKLATSPDVLYMYKKGMTPKQILKEIEKTKQRGYLFLTLAGISFVILAVMAKKGAGHET